MGEALRWRQLTDVEAASDDNLQTRVKAITVADRLDYVLLAHADRLHASKFASMLLKLFRKPTHARPQIQHDAALAEELARRVNAIEFRPSKGFLKDQQQPKRSARSRPA